MCFFHPDNKKGPYEFIFANTLVIRIYCIDHVICVKYSLPVFNEIDFSFLCIRTECIVVKSSYINLYRCGRHSDLYTEEQNSFSDFMY